MQIIRHTVFGILGLLVATSVQALKLDASENPPLYESAVYTEFGKSPKARDAYLKDLTKVWPIGDVRFAQTDYDREVAQDILNGGYILVFRHPHRQKWIDVTMYDALELLLNHDAEKENYKNAVCLSPEQGIPQAEVIGQFIDMIKVPFGFVLSSPSCRARQLSKIAFGRIDQIEPALLHFYGTPYGPFDKVDIKSHFEKIKQSILNEEINKNFAVYPSYLSSCSGKGDW